MTGLKRKHPEIDIDATLASATSIYSYMTEPVTMNVVIGGPDAGRSIVKSAFALAVASGVAASDCDEAKRYLASGEDGCFGYFNEVDLMEGRPQSTVGRPVELDDRFSRSALGSVQSPLGLQAGDLQGDRRRPLHLRGPQGAAVLVGVSDSSASASCVLAGPGIAPRIAPFRAY